jgi:undecaprenyl diphosphate synthase
MGVPIVPNVTSSSLLQPDAIRTLDAFKQSHPQWQRLSHVAIIMDGNRRWAKERFMPSLFGHKEGSKRLKEIISASTLLELDTLSTYAFSTENWQRSHAEVSYLMKLMADVLSDDLHTLADLGVRIRVLGQQEALPSYLKDVLQHAEAETALNTGLELQLAINYGGRAELTHAVQKIATLVQEGLLQPAEISEATIEAQLSGGANPCAEPDLVIRTSGEQRLSNFLIWQSAYSELYFTPTPWPDFTVQAYCHALGTYFQRKRRFGC